VGVYPPLHGCRGLGRGLCPLPRNLFSILDLKVASFGALWDAGWDASPYPPGSAIGLALTVAVEVEFLILVSVLVGATNFHQACSFRFFDNNCRIFVIVVNVTIHYRLRRQKHDGDASCSPRW